MPTASKYRCMRWMRRPSHDAFQHRLHSRSVILSMFKSRLANRGSGQWRWVSGLVLSCILTTSCILVGCHAQRPDVASEVARLTGLENAIVFRDTAEPIDKPSFASGALTPGQAVRLAVLHDPRIQASLARVRVAEADANQARLLPNP